MGYSFCDCPQVLLSALPPTARKGECEGGTFDGFPHSRSITRPRATRKAPKRRLRRMKRGAFEEVSRLSAAVAAVSRLTRRCAPRRTQKNTTQRVVFWSGRRGSNSLPGIPRMADAIRRNPASPLDLTRFAQVEAASSPLLRHIPKKNTPSCRMGCSFLERATRLELATSTLARSRSTR